LLGNAPITQMLLELLNHQRPFCHVRGSIDSVKLFTLTPHEVQCVTLVWASGDTVEVLNRDTQFDWSVVDTVKNNEFNVERGTNKLKFQRITTFVYPGWYACVAKLRLRSNNSHQFMCTFVLHNKAESPVFVAATDRLDEYDQFLTISNKTDWDEPQPIAEVVVSTVLHISQNAPLPSIGLQILYNTFDNMSSPEIADFETWIYIL
jgi:hypothetical protein